MIKGYQESSVGKHSTTTQLCRSHQSSSSCDLQVRRLSRPSQGSVVFRYNDSAGHHIKNNVGPFRHGDSAGRSQRVKGFSFQKNQAQYLNRSYRNRGAATNSSLLPNQLLNELNRSHYLLKSKAVKEQRNYLSTVAKTHEHCTTLRYSNPATLVSKMVSIESPREDLGATSLAPNGGEKQWQSMEIGFRLTVAIEGYRGCR
ncbi:hypothetical protein F511_25591 [Dorcoceras hygrometricum]|uniref:Uncharacterized protein n=1 Tax=Dorcoceras hygrometricum TaxID=472368 RepID=A0A2Z7CU62_9LAMI|nr:hypothetical protein F511_25591 [Dorcoceras hygrometricum]